LRPGLRPGLRLGFNSRVSFNDQDGPARGLRDGIELFKAAEALGYHSGWTYQRHFDHYLSSPLPFLAAVGQHTQNIRLGTALIPMRYQEPVLLAEAAATTDLLVGERLDLAVSTGDTAAFDAIFGAVAHDARSEARLRQTRLLAALSGEVLHRVGPGAEGAPEGTELRVTPHSPTLRRRIRQGASSIGSVLQAAERGIGLILGTVQHGFEAGESFSDYQARSIDSYRQSWRRLWDTEPPPVAVAASILVGNTAELREKYAAYDLERRTHGIAASRPAGALAPSARTTRPPGSQISPVIQGDADQVAAAILDDAGLSRADELILFLPPAFGLTENIRILSDFAQTVAPQLGWQAAGAAPVRGAA
jgi:alkanesulfonate monooxygenase SsuD/methylene tetrahydromethanopterin reductase-like flavin-dependent oxidoreductase (luciferase family)